MAIGVVLIGVIIVASIGVIGVAPIDGVIITDLRDKESSCAEFKQAV
jgi:hypothetical protein